MQIETRSAGLPVVLVAAVALIDVDGRVLLAQRPEGKAMAGLWEFPGGKVAEGETPEACAVRELAEELGIDITESCLAPLAFASHAYEDFHLLMPLFACRVWKGQVTPLEGQALKWARLADMRNLPMPPADQREPAGSCASIAPRLRGSAWALAGLPMIRLK